MSTRLLYHAFGIRGYDDGSRAYEEGRVIFTFEQRRPTYRCSRIRTMQQQAYGFRDQEFFKLKSWPSTRPSTL
jgi:hypothetical protein